jgi:hypothetical protein
VACKKKGMICFACEQAKFAEFSNIPKNEMGDCNLHGFIVGRRRKGRIKRMVKNEKGLTHQASE